MTEKREGEFLAHNDNEFNVAPLGGRRKLQIDAEEARARAESTAVLKEEKREIVRNTNEFLRKHGDAIVMAIKDAHSKGKNRLTIGEKPFTDREIIELNQRVLHGFFHGIEGDDLIDVRRDALQKWLTTVAPAIGLKFLRLIIRDVHKPFYIEWVT